MDSKTNRIKVMLDDKECGEGIYHICYEQETKGCAIPSFLSTTQDNGMVKAQNPSVALGISLRTTKRNPYVLRDMHLIQFVGSDKTGHWEFRQ